MSESTFWGFGLEFKLVLTLELRFDVEVVLIIGAEVWGLGFIWG
jgi:hypothetical protein